MSDKTITTIRFTAQRKYAICHNIRAGELTEHQACKIYDISPWELQQWFNAIDCGFSLHVKNLILFNQTRLVGTKYGRA